MVWFVIFTTEFKYMDKLKVVTDYAKLTPELLNCWENNPFPKFKRRNCNRSEIGNRRENLFGEIECESKRDPYRR